MTPKNKTIHDYFKDWCKLTHRSGGVILGSSLREFFDWYTDVVEPVNKPSVLDAMLSALVTTKEKEDELKVYDDLKFLDVNEQIKNNKP